MSDELTAAIGTLFERVERKEKELVEQKRMINMLCAEAGIDPLFELVDDGGGGTGVKPDEFYGKSPITAAREYLEKRHRAASGQDILAALEKGGFDFEAQGWTNKDARLRNLTISMSKNSLIFHRLPNGYYGLVKFYPGIETEKKQKKGIVSTVDPVGEVAEAVEGAEGSE